MALTTSVEILHYSGLSLNIIGTIILTISLNKYLVSIHSAIALHDISLMGLIKQDSRVLRTDGLDDMLFTAIKSSRFRTRIGLIIVCLGFVIQIIPLFLFC